MSVVTRNGLAVIEEGTHNIMDAEVVKDGVKRRKRIATGREDLAT